MGDGGSILVAVVLACEPLHIIEGDFPLIIAVEDALVAGDVGGGGVEFFVHGPVEVHQHFSGGYGLEHSVFVVVVHVEELPGWGVGYWVSWRQRSRLKRPPFYIFETGSYLRELASRGLYIQILFIVIMILNIYLSLKF